MQPVRPNAGWTAVDEAVRLVGGPTKAALACRVSFHAVYKWRIKGLISDSRSAVMLSEATGGRVSVRELAGIPPGEGPGIDATDTAPATVDGPRRELEAAGDESSTVARLPRRGYPAPREASKSYKDIDAPSEPATPAATETPEYLQAA